MSFHETDLHTMIVRAHDQRKIAIGKVMRVTLQAIADGEFPVHDLKGSTLSKADRNWLETLAAEAEAQHEFRWWDKRPWLQLQRMRVNETQFWSWLDRETADSRPMGNAEKPTVKQRDPLKQSRASPEIERAAKGLKSLYSDGHFPDQQSVRNKVLLNKVNDCLASMTPALDPVRMDSLLRAAGRRNK